MRLAWIFLIALVGAGCASSPSATDSLEPILPDTEPDSLRFFHGSWIWPDSIYAFQISESVLYVADPLISRSEAQELSVDDCPMIASVFADLKSSVFQTFRIASGEVAVKEADVIATDGPDYRVEYWSREASTVIILSGDSNSQFVTPWVDAAYRVRAIGESCGIERKRQASVE